MCLVLHLVIRFVRICTVVGLLLLAFTGSAFAKQNTTKVTNKAPHPPITEGWELKHTFTNPATNTTPRKSWKQQKGHTPMQQIKAKLTDSDYLAALQAIQHALSEVADGKTYVWRSTKLLRGKIQPTNVFRDVDSRLCRHVIYTLYVETYSKSVEGIACRTLTGRWDLSG